MIELWFTVDFAEEKKKKAIRRVNRMLRGEGSDIMQSTIDKFGETYSVPQIFKDRLGRCQFTHAQNGLKDCSGFAYKVFGRYKK